MTGDAEILGGVMRSVDAIAHVGDLGQCLEPVQQPGRDVHVPECDVVEQEDLVLTERGRIRSRVDENVVNGAVRTAHELGLPGPGSAVHPADHPAPGPGLGVLDEGGGRTDAQPAVEHLGIERAGEPPARVMVWLRNQQRHPRQPGRFDSHQVMVS